MHVTCKPFYMPIGALIFFLHESQADCIWSVPYCMLFEIGPNKSHVISTLGIKIIEKCNVQFLNSDLRVSITKYAD